MNFSLPWAYTWKITIRRHQKLMHIIYGNTTKLVSKLCTNGLPKLPSDVSDAEKFLSYTLDLQGWCAINGATSYVIGPALPRPPATQVDERNKYDALMAEGLKYLAASIENADLKGEVARRAMGSGPQGFAILQRKVLQGMAPGPALQQVLDDLRFSIDGNVVAFQARFTKFSSALQPMPAANVLCQKFVHAITADTNGLFDDCVTTILATDDLTDFERFSDSLTKAVSLKATRMTAQNPSHIGQNAQAHQSSGVEPSELQQLQKRIEELEKQLEAINGDQDTNTNEKPVCDYTFPNGDACGGNHQRRNCWFEDPTRCRNPDIRRHVERKIQSKSYPCETAEAADIFFTEIVEKPLHKTCTILEDVPGNQPSTSFENHNSTVKKIGGGGAFIIDPDATDHIICDEQCILHPEDHEPVDVILRTGTGSTRATSRGPATFTIHDEDGNEYSLTRNVLFCPEFKMNIFSPQRDFKDHSTHTVFDGVCCLTFKDKTVIPFSTDGQIFQMSYMYPSESSGVLKSSDNDGIETECGPMMAFNPVREHPTTCVPCENELCSSSFYSSGKMPKVTPSNTTFHAVRKHLRGVN